MMNGCTGDGYYITTMSHAPLPLLEIYFKWLHSAIGRYKTPSLHTAIEMLSGIVTAMGRV